VRAELQNAADAASLAAVRDLNSTAGGLTDAVSRANTVANSYNFTHTSVTVSKIEFAVNLDGAYTTWSANMSSSAKDAIKTARFVRVTTQTAALPVLFSGAALGSSHDETGVATAGMSVGLNKICSFYPVAIALSNTTPSASPTPMTITFTNGTGSSVAVANKGYVVLDVPDISGNGAPETANLSAGNTSICASIGGAIAFNNTQSAGPTNGPRQVADGANTRFDTYQNGYANSLNATSYPPDTNIRENITNTQYFNKSPLTAPSHTGKDDRRILIMPIIAPGTYNPSSVTIVKFGAFFLRSRLNRNGANAGNMDVEYLGDGYVIGSGFFDPTGSAGSNLTVPVLYK